MKLHVSGDIAVPGDKSISHRALMLAAAAEGTSRLSGVLAGADCASTAAVLRSLGCAVPPLAPDGNEILITSRGLAGWSAPAAPLDCGHSGTTARLMLGLLAGRPLCATLTGDASLRSRPMRRVTEPLERGGARFTGDQPDRLPLEICGGPLAPLSHRASRASAQVKSAVLLAGLSAGVPAMAWEPFQSRDHTERMLAAMGQQVESRGAAGGWEVRLQPQPLVPLDTRVPGDFSSAAFLLALATLADSGELRIRGVGINPTRTGFLSALLAMGGTVRISSERFEGGEPVADLEVASASLRGVEIGAAQVPALIDELPLLAVLAARAEGETRITGAAELRVKESDRIATIVGNLVAVGAEAAELPDGFVISGHAGPLRGRVITHGDHRIAMAFGVLAKLPRNRISIDDRNCAAVSFPGFWNLLDEICVPSPPVPPESFSSPSRAPGARGAGLLIAIDGPAGSGTSSTAKAVAAELGYRHLDSGALYRGLTFAALEAGIPPEHWPQLTANELDGFKVSLRPSPGGFQVFAGDVAPGERLRTARVNAHVSAMAMVPAVRSWLLGALREAGARGGLVADGRDIGTVVFPDADLKVFLVCAPEERAARRLRERGEAAEQDAEIRAERDRLLARDAVDSAREAAPLLRAADAVQLDTTGLAFDKQVAAVVRLARGRVRG